MPSTARFVSNAAALPSMPEIANRLLRPFDDQNLGMPQLAELIGQDQGLSI